MIKLRASPYPAHGRTAIIAHRGAADRRLACRRTPRTGAQKRRARRPEAVRLRRQRYATGMHAARFTRYCIYCVVPVQQIIGDNNAGARDGPPGSSPQRESIARWETDLIIRVAAEEPVVDPCVHNIAPELDALRNESAWGSGIGRCGDRARVDGLLTTGHRVPVWWTG